MCPLLGNRCCCWLQKSDGGMLSQKAAAGASACLRPFTKITIHCSIRQLTGNTGQNTTMTNKNTERQQEYQPNNAAPSPSVSKANTRHIVNFELGKPKVELATRAVFVSPLVSQGEGKDPHTPRSHKNNSEHLEKRTNPGKITGYDFQ